MVLWDPLGTLEEWKGHHRICRSLWWACSSLGPPVVAAVPMGPWLGNPRETQGAEQMPAR